MTISDTANDRAENNPRIQHELRDAIDAIGIERVALEIGLSSSTIRAFLGGASPQTRTLRRLQGWASGQHHQATTQDTTKHDAAEQLLDGIPTGPLRERAHSRLLGFVAFLYRSTQAPTPPWLRLRHNNNSRTAHPTPTRKTYLTLGLGVQWDGPCAVCGAPTGTTKHKKSRTVLLRDTSDDMYAVAHPRCLDATITTDPDGKVHWLVSPPDTLTLPSSDPTETTARSHPTPPPAP